MTQDEEIFRREEVGPLHHAVRVLLTIYALPVILLVLGIGLVAMLAAGGRPTPAKAGVEGVHRAHKRPQPLGARKIPAQVREMV